MKKTFFAFLIVLLLFTGTGFAQTKSGFTNNSGGILHAGQVVINDFSIASGMTTTTGATVGVEVLGVVYGNSTNDGETGLVTENWFIWVKDGGILCTNAVSRGDGLALSTGTAGSATSQGAYSGNKDEYTFAVATTADAAPPYRVSAFILRHGAIASASVGDADTVDGFHAAGTATASYLLALDAEKDLHLGTGDLSATLGTFEGNVVINNAANLNFNGADNDIQGSGVLRINSGNVAGAGSVNITGSGGVNINSGDFGGLGDITLDARVSAIFEIDSSVEMTLTNVGLGIGQSSPDTLLHLAAIDGSAILRLERDDTSIEDGNIYGVFQWEGQDASTNADGVRANIQVEGADNFGATEMVFNVTAGSSTSLVEILRLKSIGVAQFTGDVVVSGGFIKMTEGEFFYPDSGNLNTRIYALAGLDLRIEADDDLILAPDNDFSVLATQHFFKDAAGANTWFLISSDGTSTFSQSLIADDDTSGFRQIIAFGTTDSFTVTDDIIDADHFLGPGGVRDTITRISAGVPIPYSGDILGIAVTFDVTAVTLDSGETLNFSVAKNGINVGPTAIWDAVAGTGNAYVESAIQVKGVDTFAVEDTLSCYIFASGDAGENATIEDVQVIIFVATD